VDDIDAGAFGCNRPDVAFCGPQTRRDGGVVTVVPLFAFGRRVQAGVDDAERRSTPRPPPRETVPVR
jgi:hypothetical protein